MVPHPNPPLTAQGLLDDSLPNPLHAALSYFPGSSSYFYLITQVSFLQEATCSLRGGSHRSLVAGRGCWEESPFWTPEPWVVAPHSEQPASQGARGHPGETVQSQMRS